METPVIVVHEDALRRIVADAVEAAVQNALPELIRRATRKPWLTRDEILELTGWSVRTLAYLRQERKIAFTQEGRKILYETASLERLLDAGYVPAKRGPRKHGRRGV